MAGFWGRLEGLEGPWQGLKRIFSFLRLASGIRDWLSPLDFKLRALRFLCSFQGIVCKLGRRKINVCKSLGKDLFLRNQACSVFMVLGQDRKKAAPSCPEKGQREMTGCRQGLREVTKGMRSSDIPQTLISRQMGSTKQPARAGTRLWLAPQCFLY